MLKTGMIIAERYEILGKIGTGGMADVYKAKDHKLNRFVAVKVLKPEFREDTTFIRKFKSEAQAAAVLTHPNIAVSYTHLDVYKRQRIYRENDLHIIGPAYASVGKVKDIYRQVIYLKHKDHKTLVHIKDQLEKYIEINSGFRKIYIQFDFS